jgi:hypothetical protein
MEERMKKILIIGASVGALASATIPAGAANEPSGEKPVSLSSVPRPALEAAQRSLRTRPTLAKIVVGTKPEQYDLWAKDDSDQRIHVRADGTATTGKQYSLGSWDASRQPAGPRPANMGEIDNHAIDIYEKEMHDALSVTDPPRRDAAITSARQQLAQNIRKPLTAGTIEELDGLLDLGGVSPELGATA